MYKTHNINHSIAVRKKGKKIYKLPGCYQALDLCVKLSKYGLLQKVINELKQIETKQLEETERYLQENLYKE